MKRKVRVTPPASNPFESNPMSTWMAQMGGAQPTQDEHITSIAAEMLSQGFEDEEVKQILANQGFPLAKVNEIIDALYAYVDEQRDLSEANYLEDELAQEQILAEQEAAEMEASEEDAYSNDMYYAPDSDPGYAEEDAAMQEILMRSGGRVPSKKQFVKQALKLKKKQEGGDEASNKADDTMAEKRPINNFIQKLTQTAQQKADEEALEQQYDQMFGDQELPEAQFGGFRNPRRAERRMNRQVNRMIRNTPMGFFNPSMQFLPSQMNFMTAPMMYPQGFGMQGMMNPGVQMANIQVTRTGLFGRPKEYTINFATTPPNQINPREVIEQEIRNTGETVKEQQQEQKEKEVSTASEDNKNVQEELITADQIEVVGAKPSGGNKGNTTQNSTPQAKPGVKRDAWGRPEGDKYYGHDQASETFDPRWYNFEDSHTLRTIIDPFNRPYSNPWFGYNQSLNKFTFKDDWGRLPDSKWYGYDPDKNIWTRGNKATQQKEKGIGEQAYNSFTMLTDAMLDSFDPNRLAKTKERLEASGRAAAANMPQRKQYGGPSYGFDETGGQTGMGLYHFVYGGDEPMMPFADESFRTYSKDATDPYFREGGLTKYQTKGQTKDAWNRSQGTIIEFPYDGMNDVWDGEKWVGSTDSETNTEPVRDNLTPRPGEPGYEEYIQERNRKKYDALKELGYNVGDYREGIDYSKLTKFPQTAKNQTKVENFPMYPGQAGYPMMGPAGVPIYPPLFNNRGGRGRGMFGPGRSIQYAGSWLQQQGLPYDPRTGQPIQGIAAPQIKSIDVKKSSLLRKLPKEYTINFVGQAPEGTGFGTFNTGFQPRKDWNTPYTPQMTGTQSSGSAYWDMRDKAFQKRIQKKARKKGYDIAPDEENVNIQAKNYPEQTAAETSNEMLPPPQYTDAELGLDKLVDVQPEIFAPEYTDAELGLDQLVNVEPENLEQYRSQFSDIGTLPIRSIFTDEQRENLRRFAPVMNSMNYNENLADIGQQERQDFELERLRMQDPYILNQSPYNTPIDPNELEFTQQPSPVIPSPAPKPSQPAQNKQISQAQKSVGKDIKKEVKSVGKQVAKEAAQEANMKKLNVKPFDYDDFTKNMTEKEEFAFRAQHSNAYTEARQMRDALVEKFENQGLNAKAQKEYYQNYKLDPWVENMMRSLPNQAKLNYIKQMQKINPDLGQVLLLRYFKEGGSTGNIQGYQTGGVNMSYPMMPKAQTLGQFNMSTPYERKNYAIMPSAEEMMQKQTPMGQFADYRNPLTGAAPAIRMGSDGEYINEGVLTDEDLAKLNQREMSVDAKVKNMYNVDFENLVNQFNAATGLGLSMFGQVGDIAKNQQAMANLTAGNVYGSKNQLNQGDWTQWGQFRPNMQGFKQEGMTTIAQRGGSTYKEGGTHYMSSKQIAEFLANGGEIEFV